MDRIEIQIFDLQWTYNYRVRDAFKRKLVSFIHKTCISLKYKGTTRVYRLWRLKGDGNREIYTSANTRQLKPTFLLKAIWVSDT